jgi:fatty acid amide hydrolase
MTTGAVPYAKTALPITLLSFESANGLWGTCRNPHVPSYSPGGSTGGEAALLAQGGRIGIGSDVAGSVRVPAAWSGIYSLRCSTGRWPKAGVSTSMPGQEGIPSVFSPMARTLDDLTYFTRAIVGMQPWKYDHSVHPIPWRSDLESEAQNRPLRIGLMSTDGMHQMRSYPQNQSLTNQVSSPQRPPLNAPSQPQSLPSLKQATSSQKSQPLPLQTPSLG